MNITKKPDIEALEAALAKATPAPWVWEQCGEKVDCPIIGIAFDKDNRQLAGYLNEIEGFGEGKIDDIYVEMIADLESADGFKSGNAEAIVALRNQASDLFAYIRALEAELKKCDEQWQYAVSQNLVLEARLTVLLPEDVAKLVADSRSSSSSVAYWITTARNCVDALTALTRHCGELEKALKLLYYETADYIRNNRLGDVHLNQSMKQARAALEKSK